MIEAMVVVGAVLVGLAALCLVAVLCAPSLVDSLDME